MWTAAFHAQQAAEKYGKAYLVAHGCSIGRRKFRTHEIDDLRALVAEIDPDLSEELAIGDVLSDYAVESRYPPLAPGVEDDVDPGEAEEAIALARSVRDVIWTRLSGILPPESLT